MDDQPTITDAELEELERAISIMRSAGSITVPIRIDQLETWIARQRGDAGITATRLPPEFVAELRKGIASSFGMPIQSKDAD